MATDSSISGLGALNTPSPATTSTKKTGEIGKDEFMQLLVTQLKSQDPMDPMKQEEFAAQLAQFSSLEQLTQINKKVGATNTTDLSGLTGYLGREVAINSNQVHVNGTDGGQLQVDLPEDADSLNVQLLNTDGSVADELSVGALPKGKHTIELSDVKVDPGDYTFKVMANSTTGASKQVAANPVGIVSGVVPGPDPTLLIGSREIKTSDIKEIRIPENQQQ